MKKLASIALFSSMLFTQQIPNNVLDNLDMFLSKKSAQNIVQEKTFGEEESMKNFEGQRALINAGKLYKSVAPSVVLVINSTENGIGSGSFIDTQGHIVTNYHVIEGANPETGITVVPFNKSLSQPSDIDENDIFVAEVIGTLKDKDLALLKIKGYREKGNKINPIKIGNYLSIEIADDVFAIGHPSSFLWYYTNGTINKIGDYSWSYSDDFKVSAKTIFTQTPTNPGNSGGPLLNNNGEMIGINSAGSPNMQNVNLSVRIDEVNTFVRNAKRGRTSKDTGFTESGWSKAVVENREFLDSLWEELDWEVFNDEKGRKVWAAEYVDNKRRKIFIIGVDLNEDNLIDLFAFDTNNDGNEDLVMLDKDDDGSFSYWYVDTNNDGKMDEEGYIDDIF